MGDKYKFIFVFLILLTLFVSLSSVSAEDLNTIQSGEVSGGVDVVGTSRDGGSGELSYDIPEDVKNVDYAGLFIHSYTAGSSNLVYGSECNVSITTNGESEQIANEQLVATEGSADDTVYVINDHVTKCFADYKMVYNITDKVQNASGKLTINVNSGPIEGYTYYNKIKLIGLVFAYNDDDSDKISYWVNSGQSWSKTDTGKTTQASFNVGTINNEISNATLDNYALSSVDGIYTLNGEDLIDSLIFEVGEYYNIYHKFDVMGMIKNGTNSLVYTPGEGSYSFRNVLAVLTLNQVTTASAKLNIASEYSGAVFAGTNNVLKVNVTNDGQDKSTYVVDLYADGVKVNSSQIQIAAGLNDILLLSDNTIRPVTADTVNGVSTTKVNYTVTVSDKASGDVLDEASITPTLWYNGNLGKDLAYPAGTIEYFNDITVNGGIVIDTLDDSTYLGTKTTNRTDVWNVNVDEDAVFTNAYVYVAYNWDKTNGTIPVWTTTFNGVTVSPVASYRDQSNLGSYGRYGYGLVVYDVASLVQKGENSFVLNKEDGMTAVYPSTLIALYNVSESDTITTAYIFNGADLLSNANNFNGRLVASNSILDVDSIDDIADAELHVFAASAQAGEGDLIVNGEEFADVWNGSSNSVNDFVVVMNDVKESNNVSFVAKGSTILALEQILVVSKFAPSVSANLTSEYSGAAFAGTDNVLKLNLTNIGHGKSTYLVDFYVDGKKLNRSEISLGSGASDVLLLIDDTIRPVTADTVNGVSTKKVNYTAVVSDKSSGDVLAESTLTPTLWYNGNLGKDLAYPAGTIESFDNVTVNGGVIIETLGDSTYLGTKTTNRTDVWTVDVDADAVFTNAYVYVAYNWDKTNGTIPVWTTTFNGVSVAPVASYRDQSNLGTYGKYGYGLVVYDVSALIKDGENSFVLNKEDGMTAVYPSTLVALYNVTESDTLTTVYMYNGADLLSNANNFNGRIVASNSILDVDLVDDIKEAELYVFAAGAQAGEGNLIVNGEEFVDVWNGSSNSVNGYVVDLSDSIKESNSLSFLAKGSTILAIQQFVIVKSPAPKTSADLQKLIDDAKPGDTIDLGNDTYANIANVNITKDLTITGGIISGKEGEAIFIIPPKSEDGPNEVNITGVDFKVNNGNVIVKASADNGTAPTSIDTPAININNNTIDVASDNVVPESVTVLELDSERGSLAPSSDIAVKGNTIASGINPFEFEVTSVAGGNGSAVIPVGGNIPERQATVIHYQDMKTSTVNTAIEGRVGKYFEVNLTDANGNPLADKEVKIGFNGKIYNRTTNATGGVNLQINLAKVGLYTFAISFLGDDNYNASFEVSKINVTAQKTKLTTSNKSYKASAKTKTLTVTLKSAEYNKALPSKKITVTVNGKSYTATTNSKGVATVKVSLSAKKTYSFTAKFAGDDRYAAASVTGKVTIK